MKEGIFTAATIPFGIYILTETKLFVQPTAWSFYERWETPACVAYVHSGQAHLIALSDFKEAEFRLLPPDVAQTGRQHKTDEAAMQDFNGLENTIGLSDSGSTIASEVLAQSLLGHTCHIPSLGEWQMLYTQKLFINFILSIIGASPIKNDLYLTSTRQIGQKMFAFSWCRGIKLHLSQYGDGLVRCISNVSLKKF